MDWRAKTKEKRERSKSGEAITADSKYLSSIELNMAKNGDLRTASWKEALRQAIDEAKVHTTDRAEFQSYLQDNFGVTMPRNTAKTVSFVYPAVGEKYSVRGNKLGNNYTAASIDEALQQNQSKIHNDRSVLDARLFATAEYPATEQANTDTATAPTWATPSTATHTTPRPHDPISPSQRQRQEGRGKRTVARSVSDISAELRSIDRSVGEIAGRGYEVHPEPSNRNIATIQSVAADHEKLHRYTGRTKPEPPLEPTEPVRELQQEPPKPSLPTQEPKRAIQQKPKRRSDKDSR